MAEKIIQANILEQSKRDLTTYAIYVARRRALPNPFDGLKPVHRKILYSLFYDFGKQTRRRETIKTQAVVGNVLQKYHPHGDSSVNASIKPMTNWFESYIPTIDHQGSFGNMSGDGAAAPRYTEVMISDYGLECVVGDLAQSPNSTDWQETYNGSEREPIYFPAVVPNLLVNGAFGIAVGLRTSVPKHNISEVIAATINLIQNPSADVVLLPDDCCGCDIVEADFKKISETGKGTFKVRAQTEICEFNKKPAIKITSLPPMVYLSNIQSKIEKLVEGNVLPQIEEVLDDSQVDEKNVAFDKFTAYIMLKKGCDPNYVRDCLYTLTDLEKTISVNMEVVYNEAPALLNYKQYLEIFINFRRERKYRAYSNILAEAKTKFHRMEAFVNLLETGKIDAVITKIRSKNLKEAELQEFLMKDIKMKNPLTPLQCSYILAAQLKALSKERLGYYKEQMAEAAKLIDQCFHTITHPEEIDRIIIEELKAADKKFGCPRRSKFISASEAAGIPEGTFKVVLTEKGIIKKCDQSENIRELKDDRIKLNLVVDNKDNLLLFSRLGKVFKVPVNKVPFGKGASGGVDLRVLMKKYTGEGICTIIPESVVEQIIENSKKNKERVLVYVMTKNGIFKSMDIAELLGVPLSGLIYTKLSDNDMVADIIFMGQYNEMIIYSNNKILRVPGTEAPMLTRSAKGVIGMKSKNKVDGFICLTPNSTDVVIITASGRVNRIPLAIVPLSKRGMAGMTGIKLNKTDSIVSIHVCNAHDTLNVVSMKEKYQIPVASIPEGSSVSAGAKLIDASGIIHTSISR